MKRENIVTLITALLLTGCMKTIHYSPDNSARNTSNAKEVIKQVVLEQPNEFIPIEVEVTEHYLKTITTKSDQMYGYTIPWHHIVYFNNIGKIKLKQKRGRSSELFIIVILDKNETVKCNIYTLHEKKAKEFIDALYTLQPGRVSEKFKKTGNL